MVFLRTIRGISISEQWVLDIAWQIGEFVRTNVKDDRTSPFICGNVIIIGPGYIQLVRRIAGRVLQVRNGGLFARFDAALPNTGYIAMSGQLIDSTLVPAPKQRNTDEEKQAVKEGKIAAEIWPDDPAKARQKDVDARWTVQLGAKTPKDGGPAPPDIAIPSFGYKNHASIDKAFRFIRRWDVTDAARQDGRMLRQGLLDTSNSGSGVWADSAYRSQANEAFIARRGFVSHVHHRKPTGWPMPKHIKRGNSTKSKHRAPVEHVFAVQKHMMGLAVRTIGVVRARTKIGRANIAYNIRRLVQIAGAVTA